MIVLSPYSYKIAQNYAQALFEISMQRGEIEDLCQSFFRITQVLKQEPALKKILKNPLLNSIDRKNFISLLVFKKVEPLFFFIIDKKRFNLLEEIAESFLEKIDAHKNITHVTLESAHAFNQEQLETLRGKLKTLMGPRHFHIEEKLNPHLLGSFRLNVDGKILDLSVATHVQNIIQEYHV